MLQTSPMVTASELIEQAFEALAKKPGFVERPDQRQLALLISDCMEESNRGLFEAPTGLGKSLAALIPAIAHAIVSGKRTVIATYTNVLAEQYWHNDLPLALSLFSGEVPKCQFLIGRQRYACLAQMREAGQEQLFSEPKRRIVFDAFESEAKLGIESEFRTIAGREGSALWRSISVPPVCPARLCPQYNACFYYQARRSAERASIVITNHNVVLQDAQLAEASEGELSLLGTIDMLIVDEAHDLPQSTASALEFELSESKLAIVAGLATRMEHSLAPLAQHASLANSWSTTCDTFRKGLESCQAAMQTPAIQRQGILAASPEDVQSHPHVRANALPAAALVAQELAATISQLAGEFVKDSEALIKQLTSTGVIGSIEADLARDSVRNYSMYIRDFALGCGAIFAPQGVSVSHAGVVLSGARIRYDTVGIAEPLRTLLWDRTPWICLSATLALDGNFDFFKEISGARPLFEEILPSPFDYSTQAALYVPKEGAIPDPSTARKEGLEDEYFTGVATELARILRAMQGRTLALFHSRREMDAVYEKLLPMLLEAGDDLPIYLQGREGVASSGERFKKKVRASLFALRSFWTGFDAPGETLSCVVLVRVPFEVPIDPAQIARAAWMQTKGQNPFMEYALPLAKMLMRQGAGRLVRRTEDRGLIAVLDPRLRTKRYGEQILDNLPSEMRRFDDVDDAVGWLGLG